MERFTGKNTERTRKRITRQMHSDGKFRCTPNFPVNVALDGYYDVTSKHSNKESISK